MPKPGANGSVAQAKHLCKAGCFVSANRDGSVELKRTPSNSPTEVGISLGWRLAGLLTYASMKLSTFPGASPQWLERIPNSVLNVYSYGVVADSHRASRTPDNPIYNQRKKLVKIKISAFAKAKSGDPQRHQATEHGVRLS
jgi:hypothetical protein